MMQFLLSIPAFRRYRRKRLHKDYVYSNMLQLRNEAVRLLISVSNGDDIQKVRDSRQKPYVICKISQGDLYLLKEAKKKYSLASKYKRRLQLLNF
jgi:hypothetical protein